MRSALPRFRFHRGSTPTLTFTLPIELDTTKDKLYITFSQDYTVKLELQAGQSGCSVEGKEATAKLTQEDTLTLRTGDVEAQLRYLLQDGTADVSNPIPGIVLRTAKEGEIE